MAKTTVITDTRPGGENHQVLEISCKAAEYDHMQKVCETCPWKCSSKGSFPAEAFRVSASTAHDVSRRSFACHQAGAKKATTCMGFILRGADHNISYRIAHATGRINKKAVEAQREVWKDGGLYDDYFEMAVDNGVGPDEGCLKPVRRKQED